MRELLIGSLLVLLNFNGYSQTWNEWFKQKKTQKKYLMEQIAALQVYGGYLKKGIDIVSDGINTISDIKNGDYNLHNDYFNNLKIVSRKVSSYSKVNDIVSIQLRIIKQYKKTCKQLNNGSGLHTHEVDFIHKVFTELLSKTADNIQELIVVTSNGKLELKDNERLQRIDKLYEDMQDKYLFTKHFSNEVTVLLLNRLNEEYEVKTGRFLNETN